MTSTPRRVAITGLGIVSPLGNDAPSTWTQLLAGASGIAEIKQFDASKFPTRIAAEVKNFTYPITQKHERFSMRFTQFALQAAKEAMRDARCQVDPKHADRFGVVVGSGMMTADFDYLTRFQQTAAIEGTPDWGALQTHQSDFFQLADFGQTTSNAGLSLLIQEFGMKGYATSVHTACASSGQALGLALQALRRQEADVILAGGFDSMITPLGLSSFCLLGALSTLNEEPTRASRPFDVSRDGFVLGEGAAFLVLEDYERAIARQAHIYAELIGEGNSLSAYRITDSHPNGDGAIQAIQGALKDAGIQPHEVDYINAHGTSTKMNDQSEANAIQAVFGAHAKNIPVSSTKSQTGHLIAAAGALEAALTVLSIQHRIVPKTANFTQADPDCHLDLIADGPRPHNIQVALSNSFGFGGSNSCVAFAHPQWRTPS